MAQYAVSNQNGGTPQVTSSAFGSASTSGAGVIAINAATGATTLRRGWVYEFEIGADGVPNATDCQISFDISVITAAGTGTAAPANPIDVGGGDAAALLTYTANYTATPTVTSNSSLFYMPLNQRASQRWIARDEKSALIIPAVNLKGIVGRTKSPNYVNTIGWQMFVTE